MNFTIRASSLGELTDCPARWEGKYLLGLRSVASSAAHVGTSIHAGTAAFDSAKLDGKPITISDAIGPMVDTLHDKTVEVDWRGGKWTPREAERISVRLLTAYCQDVAPQFDYSGVEVTCENLDITMPNGITITLTGTTDRLYRRGDARGIADLKSGLRSVDSQGNTKTSPHGAQIGVYELLAEQATKQPITLPAKIIGLSTTKATTGIGEITGARNVLVGTPDEPGLLHHVSTILKAGAFYGNPKSQLCGERYCPRFHQCKWRY